MSDVTISAGNGALMSFIERASRDPDFSIEKFESLLRMQREVEHEQARKAFNRAMAACQAEMLPVVRDAKNSHLGNKYAKLETIDAQMRPIYTRHGFSVRYGSAPAPREGEMRIICTVAHDGGYFEQNYLDSPISLTGSQGGRLAVTPVQAIGSVVTYLRRYLLNMVFNIVLEDDDDDGEGQRRAPVQQKPANPRMTVAQWLDSLALALQDAKTPQERERIVAGEQVQKALTTLQNGALDRLRALIKPAPSDTPGEPEEPEEPPLGEPEATAYERLLERIAISDVLQLHRLPTEAAYIAELRQCDDAQQSEVEYARVGTIQLRRGEA